MRCPRAWLFVSAAALAALALVACNGFSGTDAPAPSTDGGAADGTTSAGDGAAAYDGGSAPDGAASATDAGGCAPIFEEHWNGGPFGGTWTGPFFSQGQVTIDVAGGLGSPALAASVSLSSSAPANAYLEHSESLGDAGADGLDLSFALRLEPPTGDPMYAEYGCELRLKGAQAAQGMVTHWNAGELGTLAGSAASADVTNTLYVSPATGWYTVHIKSTVSGATTTFAFDARDSSSASPGASSPVSTPAPFDTVTIRCGISYASLHDGGAASMSIGIDDVVLRRCPK